MYVQITELEGEFVCFFAFCLELIYMGWRYVGLLLCHCRPVRYLECLIQLSLMFETLLFSVAKVCLPITNKPL
mgnify:CR=1 FL=1